MSLEAALDHTWLIACGVLVMLMQAGLAMVETGACRLRNAQQILLKNVSGTCMSALGWWIFGWSIAFSGPYKGDRKENGLFGYEQFAGHNFLLPDTDGWLEPSPAFGKWFFHWAVCCLAVGIMSTGLAERASVQGSMMFSFIASSVIYPAVVAWTWGGGWLSDFNRSGFLDFAGSGVVHLSGGVGALLAAMVAGPRPGRFDGLGWRERVAEVPGEVPGDFVAHSLPVVVFGTMILWFGWYGLNCGSTMGLHHIEKGMLAAQIAMNMTLAASTAGIVVFMLRVVFHRRYDLGGFCCGILAGLVSVSASCSSIECGSALAVSFVGALVYEAASTVMKLAKIDDPVDAFATHGACGLWGVLAAAVFDWGKGFSTLHGAEGFRCMYDHSLWRCKGQQDSLVKNTFIANLAEIGAIFAWVAVMTSLVTVFLSGLGLTRLSRRHELDFDPDAGFDEVKHDPTRAYDLEDVMPRTCL